MTPAARQALRAVADAQQASAEALRALAAEPDDEVEARATELVPIDATKIERATLRRLVREGCLEPVRLGRRVFYRRSDLDALAEPEAEPEGLARRAAAKPTTRPARVPRSSGRASRI